MVVEMHDENLTLVERISISSAEQSSQAPAEEGDYAQDRACDGRGDDRDDGRGVRREGQAVLSSCLCFLPIRAFRT